MFTSSCSGKMGAGAKRINYWQTTLKGKTPQSLVCKQSASNLTGYLCYCRCTLVQQDAEELLFAIIGRLREESEEVLAAAFPEIKKSQVRSNC